MSKSVKPIMGIYEDENGSKYIKLTETKEETQEAGGDHIIDLEHTDNESDGESEEYLPTDEDEGSPYPSEEDEDEE